MCWCKRLFAPGRDLITLTFSVFLLVLASAPASAQFYVRSPEVDKGEAEIEEHGALYSGPVRMSGLGKLMSSRANTD